MSAAGMSLKAKIRNYAQKNNIPAQVVLQNYMFERFLERLSLSEYKNKFIIKGGVLISTIVGLDTRSTMDLDITIKNLSIARKELLSYINDIINIKIDDGVQFNLISADDIRKDDIYGGLCVRLDAIYDTLITPLSIDVSTGDVITPSPIPYEVGGIFNEKLQFEVLGYNIETIMAEKAETILSRGIYNTRPKDFYDVYILFTTQNYDKELFKKALISTATHRNSLHLISDIKEITSQLKSSSDLEKMWTKYKNKFNYAKDIEYSEIISVIENIFI